MWGLNRWRLLDGASGEKGDDLMSSDNSQHVLGHMSSTRSRCLTIGWTLLAGVIVLGLAWTASVSGFVDYVRKSYVLEDAYEKSVQKRNDAAHSVALHAEYAFGNKLYRFVTSRSAVDQNLYAVAWHSKTEAFVRGGPGRIDYYSPSSRSWSQSRIRQGDDPFYVDQIRDFFVSPSYETIFAFDERGKMWRSANAKTFESVQIPEDFKVYAMSEADGRLIAVGDGAPIYSPDGGETWIRSPVSNLPQAKLLLKSVTFLRDRITVMAVGDSGALLISKDQGASWDYLESGTQNDLTMIVSFKGQAMAFSNTGELIVSRNLGIELGTADHRLDGEVRAVEIQEGYLFAALDSGVIERTWDGAEWERVHAPNQSAGALFDIAATQNGLIFAVGAGRQFLMSRDAGDNWSALEHDAPGGTLTGIAVAGDGHKVFAIGWSSSILHNPDNGDKELKAILTRAKQITGRGKRDLEQLDKLTIGLQKALRADPSAFRTDASEDLSDVSASIREMKKDEGIGVDAAELDRFKRIALDVPVMVYPMFAVFLLLGSAWLSRAATVEAYLTQLSSCMGAGNAKKVNEILDEYRRLPSMLTPKMLSGMLIREK